MICSCMEDLAFRFYVVGMNVTRKRIKKPVTLRLREWDSPGQAITLGAQMGIKLFLHLIMFKLIVGLGGF